MNPANCRDFPVPWGLIRRLDGAEKRRRKLAEARTPGVDENGLISLPPAWEGKVTAGRMACVAHTWALSILVKETRKRQSPQNGYCTRHDDLPFFTGLVASGHDSGRPAEIPDCPGHRPGMLGFLYLLRHSYPVPGMESREMAKSGLKEAGLWPQLPSDAMAIEQCLKALTWCHVAGFRRILPR